MFSYVILVRCTILWFGLFAIIPNGIIQVVDTDLAGWTPLNMVVLQKVTDHEDSFQGKASTEEFEKSSCWQIEKRTLSKDIERYSIRVIWSRCADMNATRIVSRRSEPVLSRAGKCDLNQQFTIN